MMEINDLKLTPKRKEICSRLELNSIEDILNYYPFRYEMYDSVRYADFRVGGQVCFVGKMINAPSTFRKGRISITRFSVMYEEEIINITIFNRPWISNYKDDGIVTIIGKYEGNNRVTASNYYARDITGQIIPYYSLKEGIGQNEIRKLIQYVLKKYTKDIEDYLPESFKERHQLTDYLTAIKNIHEPVNRNLLTRAIARLKYDEFLRFYVALDVLNGNGIKAIKEAKVFDNKQIEEFVSSFSFTLTKDQHQAMEEILSDIRSEKVMYRLVQGEVGSGKTAVAMIGLYANYLSGYQGALMVPTEILAKQHYESLKAQFEPFGVRIGVLYSSLQDDKKIKEDLANGDLDIVVGTHALFSEDVKYHRLGLVIADEQQRFGVKQRQALKEKGENTDFILMSATPIPRTLASSIYGDMDISTIASLPAGRKGCKTYLLEKNSIVDILDDLKEKLAEGRQIYIIAAAIDKSDNYKAKDVSGLYDSLIDVFKPYQIGFLHGKMSTEEKDLVMSRFNKNQIQVLISTTVVEVGVNVKNATVMIIYDADRFGLSQLHQLRGRVQRSDYEGTCYLLTDNKDEDVRKRLEILVNSNDGFEISYQDLKLRGPGDILGTRQSGLPAFILGNLIEDTKFIAAAKDDAHEICMNLDNQVYKKYYDKIVQNATKNILG